MKRHVARLSPILVRCRRPGASRILGIAALLSVRALGSAPAAAPVRGLTLPPRCSAPDIRGAALPLTPALLTQRIVAISARYRGTPYRRDPLGEGPAASVDRDPLICTTGVDCQTYVEQVLAEAIAARPAGVLPCLTRIRYRDGVIGFATRNHYMVSDWLPHNRWLVRDLTAQVGGRNTHSMEKVIDRAAFFRAHGAPELGQRIPPELSRTTYIPRAALPAVAARIPAAAVLIWVQDRPGIIAAHCGFAIRAHDGVLLFRHASERKGLVLDEPLLAYARRAPARILGLKVCRADPPLDTRHRPR